MAYDFDTIAGTYDRLNHIMTLGMDRSWRRRTAALVAKGDIGTDKVLDIACGTGDMTLELLRQGCTVTGIDLSDEMLNVARRKTSDADFMVADAEHLPFPDASFDAVTSAFGVRNFVHLDQGLSEMARVLRPGGTLAILEMSTPDSAVVRPFYRFYTRHIIPRLGQRIAHNRQAYTYLPDSIEKFPKGKAFTDILAQQGVTPTHRKFLFGVCRLYICKKTEIRH